MTSVDDNTGGKGGRKPSQVTGRLDAGRQEGGDRPEQVDALKAALRESEARFRTIFETTGVGAVLTDSRGRIGEANSAFAHFVGREAKALRGESMLDLFHPGAVRTRKQLLGLLAQASSEQVELEVRFRDDDESDRWGHVSLTFVRTAARAQAESVVWMVQDISARKRMEQELLRVETLQSLAVLSGGIAHDFNNILTAVLGNINLAAAMVPRDSAVQERLRRAREAAGRARDLTRQLMTFARGSEPIKRIVPLGRLLADTAELALSGSRARLRLVIPDDLWLVRCDEGQVRQVFHNLFMNAAQAMPDGGTLTVQARNLLLEPKEDSPPLLSGRYVRVDVQDEGIGIPREDVPHVFDPFFSTKTGGSGLGLATAYTIIQKHDGHIGLTSQEGRGTNVTVYLPAVAEEAARPPAAEAREELTPPLEPGGRVLVMDDDEAVCEVASELFRRLGFEVVLTRDGDEALSTYREAKAAGHPFDLVIMDLTIPGGRGGAETIGPLLELDPAARAVVSSGYSAAPVMADFAEHGFAAALPKPYTLEELESVVMEVLEDTKQ